MAILSLVECLVGSSRVVRLGIRGRYRLPPDGPEVARKVAVFDPSTVLSCPTPPCQRMSSYRHGVRLKAH